MPTLPDQVLVKATNAITPVIGHDHSDVDGTLWLRIRRTDGTAIWLAATDTIPMGA